MQQLPPSCRSGWHRGINHERAIVPDSHGPSTLAKQMQTQKACALSLQLGILTTPVAPHEGQVREIVHCLPDPKPKMPIFGPLALRCSKGSTDALPCGFHLLNLSAIPCPACLRRHTGAVMCNLADISLYAKRRPPTVARNFANSSRGVRA